MKILSLQQGTPEWAAHRAQHFNASDAPAMLGVSPYKPRADLVREAATGIRAEVDPATQRRFDDGHRAEALARPLAEQIINDELFPCTGSEGPYSASFDGLTMDEETGFEHKALNDALRAAFADMQTIAPQYREQASGNSLPIVYRVQMEHQCMVSGAKRVLFMASKWDSEGNLVEEQHCWYFPDPELRARLVAGWEQFERDVAAYEVAPISNRVVAEAVEALPAISVQVSGQLTVHQNFRAFETQLRDFLDHKLIREPKTDQDFADLDQQIKALKDAEAALDGAGSQMLAQVEPIDSAMRMKDLLSRMVRENRLMAEKLLAAEKERRRAEIVDNARRSVVAHYEQINATLGEHRIQPPQSLQIEIANSIKGKKTLSSVTDAANTAAANFKIAASQKADAIRVNVDILQKDAGEHLTLFADRVTLCATKAPEDLRNLIAARVGEHQRQNEAKLEAERARIRDEEAAKVKAEAEAAANLAASQAAIDADRIAPAHVPAALVAASEPLPASQSGLVRTANPSVLTAVASTNVDTASARRVKLGDINAALLPLTISAEGLASIGFHPVATERASKLYAASDLPRILMSLSERLANAARQQVAA